MPGLRSPKEINAQECIEVTHYASYGMCFVIITVGQGMAGQLHMADLVS